LFFRRLAFQFFPAAALLMTAEKRRHRLSEAKREENFLDPLFRRQEKILVVCPGDILCPKI